MKIFSDTYSRQELISGHIFEKSLATRLNTKNDSIITKDIFKASKKHLNNSYSDVIFLSIPTKAIIPLISMNNFCQIRPQLEAFKAGQKSFRRIFRRGSEKLSLP